MNEGCINRENAIRLGSVVTAKVACRLISHSYTAPERLSWAVSRRRGMLARTELTIPAENLASLTLHNFAL